MCHLPDGHAWAPASIRPILVIARNITGSFIAGSCHRALMLVLLLSITAMSGCGDKPADQANTKAPPDKAAENFKDKSAEDVTTRDGQTPEDSANGEDATASQTGEGDGTNTADAVTDADPGNATDSQSTAPPFDLDQATERFLFFTPQGPLLVDLVIAIDGAPYMAVIDGLIQRLLQTESSEPLTWEQALQDVRFIGLRLNQLPAADEDLAAQIARWDSNSNGTVEADEVRAYVSSEMDEAGATITFDSAATRTVLDRWWRSMDTDLNGQLTSEEARAVSGFLNRHDTDDDEVISLRDILPSQLSGDNARESVPLLSVHLTDLANWNTISYQLDQRYYVDGELSPASFPLDPELFDNMDLDGDGYLRTNEVARLAEIAPHVILNVNFGSSEFRPAGLHVLPEVSLLTPAADDPPSPNRARFEISGSQIAFRAADAGGDESIQQAAMQFVRRLDANGDGYLDATEANAFPGASGDRFAILDADDNEMLVAEEIVPVLTWNQATRLTNVTIAVRGEEHSAFAALDVNTDGRVTAREMQSAEQRLMSLDADGDGVVRYRELPTTISVEVRRADGTAEEAPPVEELRWFDSMDTNDDGDISRREFLGSDEQFKTLDENNDGLIDRQEALAAGQF